MPINPSKAVCSSRAVLRTPVALTGVSLAALLASASCDDKTIAFSDAGRLASMEQGLTYGTTKTVLVNQIGYLKDASKIGIGVGACGGRAFRVKNSAGTQVWPASGSGTTSAAIVDPGSGDTVCRADFSAFTTAGTGYHLEIDGFGTSVNFDIKTTDLYPDLFEEAVAYFTFHRKGSDVTAVSLPSATGSGSVVRNWSLRGVDAALSAYNGWTTGTFNVNGGWTDAGDMGEYPDNASVAHWGLQNLFELTGVTSAISYLPDTENANTMPDLLDEIDWGSRGMAGFLPADTTKLAAHKCHDDNWATQEWPTKASSADETTSTRHCMGPSVTATYALARVFGQLSRQIKPYNVTKANSYWSTAKSAWSRTSGKESQTFAGPDGEGGGDYPDMDTAGDKFAAAAEMYLTAKARNEATSAYLPSVTGSSQLGVISRRYMDWEKEGPQGNLSLMAYHLKTGGTCTSTACTGGIAGDIASLYTVRNSIVAEADSALTSIQTSNGYPTPIAGTDYPWGSNKVVVHAQIIMAYAYELTGALKYLKGMHRAMDYLMGVNTERQSFVTGWGEYSEKDTHDRMANGNSPKGWLSGGPINAAEVNDPVTPTNVKPAKNYAAANTFANAWCSKENTIDWNAPLAWVAYYLRAHTADLAKTASASCTDDVKNGDETDIDCGGSCTTNCANGKACAVSTDCASNNCSGLICHVATTTQAAYGGTARPVPGKIQAEDFDNGGPGVSYSDTTVANSGSAYRPGQEPDIQATGDTDGGYNIGWTANGEWLEYTVNVAATGTYDIEFRVAATATGKTFHLNVDGTNKTGTVAVPNTGATQTFTTVTETGISLTAGSHVLRVVFDVGGFNLNWINIVASGAPAPTCSDAVENGTETDVDCGGSCTANCANGKGCAINADCASGNCISGVCQATASCTDAIQNGSETDVDCGGSCAANCANGKHCAANSDCMSNNCVSGTCQAVSGTPCANPITVTGGNTSNFNTTAATCYRTADAITGWGCSNFDGRTVQVNGTAKACGATPITKYSDGYYYFFSSAGTYSYASIHWW